MAPHTWLTSGFSLGKWLNHAFVFLGTAEFSKCCLSSQANTLFVEKKSREKQNIQIINSHTHKLSHLPTTLQAGLPVVTKFFLLLRFPSMLWDYQVKPNIRRKIFKILQFLGWNQIRRALHSGTSQLSYKHWPSPRWEDSSWVETHNVAEIHCRLKSGGNEVYKTEGKFSEITVNIYFRHSSRQGNIEMFFPQHFFLPSRPYTG